MSVHGEEAKNPGPELLALSHPKRRFLRCFLHAEGCWSNGLVE